VAEDKENDDEEDEALEPSGEFENFVHVFDEGVPFFNYFHYAHKSMNERVIKGYLPQYLNEPIKLRQPCNPSQRIVVPSPRVEKYRCGENGDHIDHEPTLEVPDRDGPPVVDDLVRPVVVSHEEVEDDVDAEHDVHEGLDGEPPSIVVVVEGDAVRGGNGGEKEETGYD